MSYSDEEQKEKIRKYHEWLDNLKPEDTVIICGSYNSKHTDKVSRVTKAIIFIGKHEHKYQRRTGQAVHRQKWTSDYLQEPTPEIMNALRKLVCISDITNFTEKAWDYLSLEELLEIRKKVKAKIEESKSNGTD